MISLIKKIFITLLTLIATYNLSQALVLPPVCPGTSLQLFYSSIDASSCSSIDRNNDTYPQVDPIVANNSGSVPVTALNTPVTYTFTCENSAGQTSSKQQTLSIKTPAECPAQVPGGAPNVSFDVSPVSGTYPTQVTYSLSQTGAGSCRIVSSAAGSPILRTDSAISANMTFSDIPPALGAITVRAECWSGANGGGTSSGEIVRPITISCPTGKTWVGGATNKCLWSANPVINSFTINKANAQQGEDFVVSFNASNADSCALSLDGVVQIAHAAKVTSQTFTTSLWPVGNHTYSLSCIGEGVGGNVTVNGSKTINITPKLYPDLRISVGPTYTALRANTPVTFTATARNYGGATTGGSFPNIFIIADGPNGTGNRTVVAANRVLTLAVNTPDDFSANHTFLNAGNYSVLACTDMRTDLMVAGDIDEGVNDNNNCSDTLNTTWSNLVVAPAANNVDLVALTLTPSTNNQEATKPIIFDFGFWNSGSAAITDDFTNVLKISTVFPPANPNFGALQTISAPFNGGRGHTSQHTYTFNTPGTYYVSTCANQNLTGVSGVSEDNIGNNCTSPWQEITITALATVDLQNVSLTFPPNIIEDIDAPFEFTITNTGTTAAPANFPSLLIISNAADFSNPYYGAAVNYPLPLNPSATGKVTFNKVFGSAGTYYVQACVNRDNTNNPTLSELSIDNNCTNWQAIVVGSGACANGATNYNACNTCPLNSNYYWDAAQSRCVLGNFNNTCKATEASPFNGCACANGSSVLPACTFDPITITIKDDVAVAISTDAAIPTTAKLMWQSNVNNCEVWDKQVVPIKIGNALRSGSLPNYDYTFTLTTAAPQNRIELKTTHLGSNSLGYDIKCNDTNLPARGISSKTIKVETYMKTVASLTQVTGGDIVAKCTPDFDYVLIKKDNVTMTGYPKTFANNQASSFTAQFRSVIGSTYTLTCKSAYSSANTSIVALKTFDPANPGGAADNLNVTAALTAGSNSDNMTALNAEDNLTVLSNDGKFDSLYAKMSSYDSWSIKFYNQYYADANNPNASVAETYSGDSGAVGTLPSELRLVAGVISNVSTINNTNDYPLGFTLKLSAVKAGISKTLWVKLKANITPVAFLTYVNTPTIPGPNLVDFTIRCKNANTYELRHVNINNPGFEVISSGVADPSGVYSKVISAYDLGNQVGGTIANIKLLCINANTGNAEKNIPIPDRAPAEIKSFNTLPLELTCPGGNNEVNLNWSIGNTYSKSCQISALTPTINPSANEQLAELNNNMLSSNIYTSISGAGTGNMMSTMDKRDANGDSQAKMQIKYVANGGKLPVSGKRLFYYSTRFTIECDARNPNPAAQTYNPANSTYSRKSIDIIAKCTTQN